MPTSGPGLVKININAQTFSPSAQQVSSPQSMGSCESLMLDLAGGGLVYHRRRSSSVGQSQGSTIDAISYADAADVEANAAAAPASPLLTKEQSPARGPAP